MYSNDKFEIPRKALLNLATKSNIFENIFEYDREWLEKTEFHKENIDILDDPESKGDGWCLWKPYVILESLKKIDDGDVLLYMDSSDTFFNDFGNFLRSYFNNNELLLIGMEYGEGNANMLYTKRDTFHYMGCDSEIYWIDKQIEAGIIGIKKSADTIKFIEEYLFYCKDPLVIKGGKNLCGKENLRGFIDHRYDQSILTILKTKHNIQTNSEVRNYIECNMWESRIDDKSYFDTKVRRITMTHNDRSPISKIWINEYLRMIDDKYKFNSTQ